MVDRKLNAPLMMPVSEKYKDMGTVVVGKIESGHVRKGDTLTLMPNRDVVEVATIYNELEEEVDRGLCGDNARIRLRGVDDEDISPGFVLTSPSKPIHAVRQFEAQLAILEHKSIICAGYSAVLHVHALSEEVVLSVSNLMLQSKVSLELTMVGSAPLFRQGNWSQIQETPPIRQKGYADSHIHQTGKLITISGQKIVALIETTAPICVERFIDYPQLGRFTLRDEGTALPLLKSRPSSSLSLVQGERLLSAK
jgi:peptide chain release factor subunit 3